MFRRNRARTPARTEYSPTSVTLTYDNEADALAIRLDDGIVDRTVELEPGTLVDVDAAGHVLLIEVIQPARRWPLEEVLERFAISDEDAAVLHGIRGGDSTLEFVEAAPLAVA